MDYESTEYNVKVHVYVFLKLALLRASTLLDSLINTYYM